MTPSATPRASSPRSVAGTPRSAVAKRLRKQCNDPGCAKVDAGGGFCVAHGGGKKCAFPGCRKGYQTGGFCRQHGGGARCQVEDCGKVDAGRGLCRAHGGGKRCKEKGCPKADVGGGYCTAHGGGRRCAEPGCIKIDQGGGKCRAHGGARRCRRDGCLHPARGATGLCSGHGGAQLCAASNCRRIVKTEGGEFCVPCAKTRAKTREKTEDADAGEVDDGPGPGPGHDHDHEDEPMRHDGHKYHRPIPPFEGMRARSSPRNEHSAMAVDSMEPFHTFVEAATNAGVTSPQRYSGDVRAERSTEFVMEQTRDDEDGDDQEEVSNYGSCLDNGCSKSFGGRCNCKVGCTCCSRARAAERAGEVAVEEAASTTRASTSTLAGPSFLELQRVMLSIQRGNVPIVVVRSVLKTVRGVRSVHVEPPDYVDHVTDGSASVESEIAVVILRCDQDFGVRDLDVLAPLGLQHEVHEISVVDWSMKEIVVNVADMMCPGNCGRTVLNALLPIATVHTANLVFDERCVVARGDMSAQQLCDAIEAVGFDPVIVAETPLSKRFVFRVVDFASVHLMGNRLRDVLEKIEGVETVLLAVNRAEVLVEATLEDAGSLLQAAHTSGIMMIEVQHDTRDGQTSPFDPTDVGRPSSAYTELQRERSDSTDGSDHVCDVKACPHNGCEQYRLTVAHTAALAVGWAVPGCAMAWGGECTCGEQCKCAGCPQHNPIT